MLTKLLITKRQKQILLAIYNSLKNEGYPPTFDDLKTQLNISSNQAIIDHLKALEKKKLIKREESIARGLKLLKKTFLILNKPYIVPFAGNSYTGTFTDTFPLQGQWKPLSSEVKQLSDKIYVIQVSGDSMIEAGINDGDQLLVKTQEHFSSGDIVVAQTPQGTTVKRFIRQNKPPFIFLKPENPKYSYISFTEDVVMQGKIVSKLNSNYWQSLTHGRFI